RERVAAYMNKATKEAKVHTSWVNPNEQYDAAVREFVFRVLANDPADPFLCDLQPLLRRVAYFGRFNALAAAPLKIIAPGVPDIYQGNELWDLSLVDPDNRHPVDFDARQRILEQLRRRLAEPGQQARQALLHELLTCAHDGRVKLLVVYAALQLRARLPELFESGSYEALQATGERAQHAVAFARVLGQKAVVIVVPRLVVQLAHGQLLPPQGPEVWGDTYLSLPPQAAKWRLRDVFTSELILPEERNGEPALPLGGLTRQFPLALLERVPEGQ
ncbi:MAG: malto-oligosyltrehalose synthase, partial [Polyangiaceae bacterium]|nr:malto-oligosyltrehalose synthase [Polyangiaceae bacterium]